MITIFAVPRSFNDQFGPIQRNAILSWLKLKPKCEIILFGDELGVGEAAREFDVHHVPGIKKNEFGTPLIDDIFEKAQKLSKYNILVYINADIILMSDFVDAVQNIKKPNFLMVSRRTDLDIKELIDFEKNDWEEKLRQKIKKQGKLHGPSGIDYLVFPKGFWKNIPPFALGRTAWDNWFLYKARYSGGSLIDATEVVKIIHQNHNYSHNAKDKIGIWNGPEAKKNMAIAGGNAHLLTIRDANFILTSQGLRKQGLTPYSIFAFSFYHFERSSFFIKIFLLPGWLGFVLLREIRSCLRGFKK